MIDVFQSLSKGVFVVPYEQPEHVDHEDDTSSRAGPSTSRRPLKKYYDEAYDRWVAAHEAYEAERTDQQIEDIADWLEGCSAPSALSFGFDTHRLPVGLMQDTSPQLSDLLGEVVKHVVVVQGRDMDLGSMIRAIALSLAGEGILSKKGQSGIDEVERWWKALPISQQTPILIYIPYAQLISPPILSELIYILSLRKALPIRLMLSVPSVTTFLGSMSHINPGGVEVGVLGLGNKRGKEDGVRAILEAASDPKAGIHIGLDLIEEIEEEHRMYGGGASSLLRSLKWRLLHHSINSPLATLCREPKKLDDVLAVLRGEAENDKIRMLFQVDQHKDAQATLNPAPRVSVLHALSSSEAYTKRTRNAATTKDQRREARPVYEAEQSDSTPRSAKRRKTTRIRSPAVPESHPPVDHYGIGIDDVNGEDKGDLKELEVLFNLWKSAGRHINLWDWLEGFRGSMMDGGPAKIGEIAVEDTDIDQLDGTDRKDTEDANTPRAARAAKPHEMELQQPDDGDEEKAAKLHAAFVRFCEEARMMGLVRARGRNKRADEVVKSIALV